MLAWQNTCSPPFPVTLTYISLDPPPHTHSSSPDLKQRRDARMAEQLGPGPALPQEVRVLPHPCFQGIEAMSDPLRGGGGRAGALGGGEGGGTRVGARAEAELSEHCHNAAFGLRREGGRGGGCATEGRGGEGIHEHCYDAEERGGEGRRPQASSTPCKHPCMHAEPSGDSKADLHI